MLVFCYHADKSLASLGAAPDALPATPAAPSAVSGLDDLLGFGDASLGLSPAPAAPPPPPRLQLDPKPVLSPAAFQAQWSALPPGLKTSQPLVPAAVAAIEANNHQVWLSSSAKGRPPTSRWRGSLLARERQSYPCERQSYPCFEHAFHLFPCRVMHMRHQGSSLL